MSRGKKILKFFGIVLVAICAAGIILLTSFNSKNQNELVCDKLEIHIDNSGEVYFIDANDVRTMLATQLGDSVRGDKLSEIPLKSIEKIIRNNPYVDHAEIFVDANAGLHIEIVQKQPLARVINKYAVNYYITEKGFKIPVSGKFTCRVPVITGVIEEGIQNPDTIETKTLQNALQIARFIRENSFWNSQIEQIDISSQNEFTLVPKLGDQLIEFGTIENMNTKFSNLELFYQKGLNYAGWQTYKTINVQFDGQIVCKKSQPYEQQ